MDRYDSWILSAYRCNNVVGKISKQVNFSWENCLNSLSNIHFCLCIVPVQVKFSELTLDMYRMLQTLEREPTSLESNSTPSNVSQRESRWNKRKWWYWRFLYDGVQWLIRKRMLLLTLFYTHHRQMERWGVKWFKTCFKNILCAFHLVSLQYLTCKCCKYHIQSFNTND